MDVGNRIRKLREKHNWSQKELADRAQINKSVMNRIELGNRPVEDHELKRFADIFDVSTDYLLGRVDDPDFYLNKEEFLTVLNEKGLDYSGLTKEEIESFNKLIREYMKTKEK